MRLPLCWRRGSLSAPELRIIAQGWGPEFEGESGSAAARVPASCDTPSESSQEFGSATSSRNQYEPLPSDTNCMYTEGLETPNKVVEDVPVNVSASVHWLPELRFRTEGCPAPVNSVGNEEIPSWEKSIEPVAYISCSVSSRVAIHLLRIRHASRMLPSQINRVKA